MDLGSLDQCSEVVKGRTDVRSLQKCILLEMKPGVLDKRDLEESNGRSSISK